MAGTLDRQVSYHATAVDPWTMTQPTHFYVINPMHIVNLRNRSRTFAVRCVERIKAISEKWFTHILLLLFLLGYAALGAVIFKMIEAPYETLLKESIVDLRHAIMKELWSAQQERFVTKERWNQIARAKLREYEAQIMGVYKAGIGTDSEQQQWTFWGSMFYCGTVFTTIGYGNIYPITQTGMAVTMLYAFIGIPLMLMVLADLGRLFTRGIKFIYYNLRLFYHTGKIQKMRRVGRRATAAPVQYMAVAWKNMPVIPHPSRSKRNSQDLLESDVEAAKASLEEKDSNPNPKDDPQENNPKDKDKDAKDKKEKKEKDKKEKQEKKDKEKQDKKDKEKQDKKDKESKDKKEKKDKVPDSPGTKEAAPDYDVDDEFNLPISMALILLVIYMTLGAFIFTRWEDWSFFQGFYFVFISMSTIGFGDFVPDHPMYMMATFIYLMFGLALTSMCINVVQEKLSAYFEAAKLRIGTTIGLDVQAMMAEEALNEGGGGADKTEMAEVHSGKRRKSKAAKTPEKLLEPDDDTDDKKKQTKKNIEIDKDTT